MLGCLCFVHSLEDSAILMSALQHYIVLRRLKKRVTILKRFGKARVDLTCFNISSGPGAALSLADTIYVKDTLAKKRKK